MIDALAFPAPARPSWLDTPGLQTSGLSLRHADTGDLSFLRELYATSRHAELAFMPWPDELKRAFCDSQFDLQYRHYTAHYTPAAFLLILRNGVPAGRLYLHWTQDELRIVDILLLPSMQRQGIGSSLLRWLQSATGEAGIAKLSLSVDQHNTAAYALYQRLGFQSLGGHGTHVHMAWTATTIVS